MPKKSARPAADSTSTAGENSKRPTKPKKTKTAVCLTDGAIGHLDAASAVHRWTQSQVIEYLINTHLSGYYATVTAASRIIKLPNQATPAETTDRPDPAESVSQAAANPD
jgi:hypothetical protein